MTPFIIGVLVTIAFGGVLYRALVRPELVELRTVLRQTESGRDAAVDAGHVLQADLELARRDAADARQAQEELSGVLADVRAALGCVESQRDSAAAMLSLAEKGRDEALVAFDSARAVCADITQDRDRLARLYAPFDPARR